MQLAYYDVYRMKSDRFILRQKVVQCGREAGIKAAVRAFGCARNTIRKWVRRYQPGKPSTLNEQSKRPAHCPHQTPQAVERQVLKLRQATGFGAERLKAEFTVSCSVGAIHRIVRQHGLVKARKKKHKTKRDLREVKERWRLFQQLSADTKYLCDIPFYWPQMKHLRLPETSTRSEKSSAA